MRTRTLVAKAVDILESFTLLLSRLSDTNPTIRANSWLLALYQPPRARISNKPPLETHQAYQAMRYTLFNFSLSLSPSFSFSHKHTPTNPFSTYDHTRTLARSFTTPNQQTWKLTLTLTGQSGGATCRPTPQLHRPKGLRRGNCNTSWVQASLQKLTVWYDRVTVDGAKFASCDELKAANLYSIF